MTWEQNKYSRDYLKWYRVINYYVRKAYDISAHELDLLLFLFSERFFQKSTFDDFSRIVDYGVDLDNMIAKGFVEVYARRQNRKHWYQLTTKGSAIIRYVYDAIEGKPIGITPTTKKMRAKKSTQAEKNYINLIEKMNKQMKEKKENPDKFMMPVDIT
jgi:predicted dehydrogenase